jgi:hypothetical protein
MPLPRAIGEQEAEIFMKGLLNQVRDIELTLQANQELIMICWHCDERLQVLSVSMPSNNVVALHCRNAEGTAIQVTGHMNAITFSFQIVTMTAPVERIKIGFDMPSSKGQAK